MSEDGGMGSSIATNIDSMPNAMRVGSRSRTHSTTERMKSSSSSSIGRKAVAHLKKVDPVMAEVIGKVGGYKGWPDSGGTHFDAVARSIVFQQLSGKAAGTIHGRFQGLY